jgi:POLQ-like helicase
MTDSSRRKAQTWPYPRHEVFEKNLRKSNAAWFAGRNYAVHKRMPYLLESWEDWPKNIILPEVSEYIQAVQTQRNELRIPFPLHKYIHHGLSSQAMLFNLVGPLVVQDNLIPLQHAFETAGITWPAGKATATFEVEDRKIFNEDTGQPTSIDLVIQGSKDERSLFIEAKLVEREFGGCSVFQAGDCDGRNPAQNFNRCYLHHIGRRYWILLKKFGFLSGLAGSSPICPLSLYYQFFREVIFAIESGGDFVLLYDQRNPSFYGGDPTGERGLMPFLLTFVPGEVRNRVHSITIQQVIEAYQQNGEYQWLTEFKSKYNLTEED